MLKKDIVDENGIKRRVGLINPHDSPDEGMPLDVFNDLEDYYGDMPVNFRKELFSRLWDMGLIEPQDFKTPLAVNKYITALRLTHKSDATNAITFITQLMESTNGNGNKQYSKDS